MNFSETCNCQELLTVTEASNTVLKQGGSFSLQCRKPGCGQSRAGVAATPFIRVPASFLSAPLFHATIIAAVLGPEGPWAPVVVATYQPGSRREETIKGHTSSDICSSACLLTSYLTCLHTAPCHTVLQEARDSGLLVGHVKSRIILESVTREEGRIDIM